MANCTVTGMDELHRVLENLEHQKCRFPNQEVIIIGHPHIDVDSILSGILAERLLRHLDFDAHFSILDSHKTGSYKIIEEMTNINLDKYQCKIEEKCSNVFFLVDHSEKTHDGHVMGIIDHHPMSVSDICDCSYVRASTAAAFMVYELMKAAEYPLTKEDVYLVILAMMIDSISFRSSKTVKIEVDIARKLAKQYDIDYDALEKYCLCLDVIDNMTIDEITSHGIREYNYHGHIVMSPYLQLDEMPDDTTIDGWLNHIKGKISAGEAEMYAFIIYDVKNVRTYLYKFTSDSIEKCEYEGLVSRGKDIMPKIKKEVINVKKGVGILKRKIPEIIKNADVPIKGLKRWWEVTYNVNDDPKEVFIDMLLKNLEWTIRADKKCFERCLQNGKNFEVSFSCQSIETIIEYMRFGYHIGEGEMYVCLPDMDKLKMSPEEFSQKFAKYVKEVEFWDVMDFTKECGIDVSWIPHGSSFDEDYLYCFQIPLN